VSSVPTVVLDGVPTAYQARGAGPVVVVPECNLEWSAYDLQPLTERFTVVTVCPRGFLASGRLPAEDYSAQQVTGDVERVLDHLDVGTYAVLGYSLNGAVASSLALGNPRVKAVVCGGFPTAGSYAGVARSRRDQVAERQRDPELWAETVRVLDPAALLAFWESVDDLPEAELVAGLACPVWSWWGGADPLFDAFGGVARHRAGIEALGLPYRELPGLDHDQALTHAGRMVTEIGDWLEPLLR
jgi:pimeloyl-ACP methyl ester carboxylesterase